MVGVTKRSEAELIIETPNHSQRFARNKIVNEWGGERAILGGGVRTSGGQAGEHGGLIKSFTQTSKQSCKGVVKGMRSRENHLTGGMGKSADSELEG